MMLSSIDQQCINTIRILAADTVQKANSGHPGAPMGCAPLAHILFSRHLVVNGESPRWMRRDRFVLSNGHACVLQYILLHLRGFPLTIDDLKCFRQLNSITPGHPENTRTPGVEVTTGPLGQGIANAVGLAIAEANLSATFNRPGFQIIDNFTYVLCGDGCLQEGIAAEALSLAGHLRLGKLIVLYDDNKITIDGETELSFSEDVSLRMQSYGFHVEEVSDGNNDIESIHQALERAKSVKDKPSFLRIKTTIGFGSGKEGTEKVHGAPLGVDDIALLKEKLGFNPTESFVVPKAVYSFYKTINEQHAIEKQKWNDLMDRYCSSHRGLANRFYNRIEKRIDFQVFDYLPEFSPKDGEMATRVCSQTVLNAICDELDEIIGGSADLTSSNLTKWKGSVDFQHFSHAGRYLRFGVREHAMAGICNGISAYGGFIPFCATFLNFIGYAQGAVRLSALSYLRVIYIMTHDSIGLGEDGPTHQPIEILPLLRATPNLLVLRPADGNEVSGSYYAALKNINCPSVICLSRQSVPQLENSSIFRVQNGAYVLQKFGTVSANDGHSIILVATGSEVAICIEAARHLHEECSFNVHVVSFPSFELFERQPNSYKTSVFPSAIPVLSVEASSTFGWAKYAHYSIGLNRFGASAPYKEIYEKFGLTWQNVMQKAIKLAKFYEGKEVSSLLERMQ